MAHNAWFQVCLSHQCNLNCSHCYVVDKCNPEMVMEDWMFDRIVDYGNFVADKYSIDSIKFTFLGGEPLMHPEKVLEGARKFKKIKTDTVLWMFTNGTLLTEDLMKRLADENVFVLVSSNNQSERDIFKRCEIIEKYQKVTRICICMSSPNLLRLPHLVEDIFRNGWSVRLFSDNWGYKSQEFFDLYPSVVPESLSIIDHYEQQAKRLLFLYENFDPRNKGEKSNYLVGKSIVVFDQDGIVRTSTPQQGIGILGNLVWPGQDWFWIMRNYPYRKMRIPRWSAQYIPECDGCEVRPVCQGGYPLPRFYAYGRFDRKTPYCELFKKCIPQYVEMYERKLNEKAVSSTLAIP